MNNNDPKNALVDKQKLSKPTSDIMYGMTVNDLQNKIQDLIDNGYGDYIVKSINCNHDANRIEMQLIPTGVVKILL